MRKFRMKKIISVFLAAVMLFVCFVPGMASPAEKTTPVLIITGFNEYPLHNAKGESVFPPATNAILDAVKGLLSPLGALIQKDYQGFCDGALPIVNELFAPIACNPDGSVKDETVGVAYQYTEALSSYSNDETIMNRVYGRKIVKAVADRIGAENVYIYGLDWRKSMGELASDVNNYIEKMKEEKGVEKVSVAGHSMGGAVLAAYIGEYGYGSISNITMINSAYTGLEMIGQLFTGNIQIDPDSLLDLITESIGSDILSKVLGATNLLNLAVPVLDDFLAAQNETGGIYKDTLFSQCLVPGFGYTPGIWSFVPDEYYEEAKTFMKAQMAENQKLGGATDSDIALNWETFENKIDSYHNIQQNIETILKEAKSNGVIVSITASYNRTIAPVTPASNLTSDSVIETVRTSGGATCADKGKTLGDNYKQAAHTNENYISADNMIDASTCFFPDNTWFIKNCEHSNFDYAENGCEIYVRLITAETQPTVNTWKEYPQFMVYNSETHLTTPLDASLGDVDFDGLITPIDSRMVLRDAALVEKLENPARAFADFNSDGAINETDARLLLERFAGVS